MKLEKKHNKKDTRKANKEGNTKVHFFQVFQPERTTMINRFRLTSYT